MNGVCIVVVNHEDQYSIWPAHKAIPAGWSATGFRGSKDECLAHVDLVWTDMRPKSLRQAMQAFRDGRPCQDPSAARSATGDS